MKNHFIRYPSPGPLTRATLSLRERDSPEYLVSFLFAKLVSGYKREK